MKENGKRSECLCYGCESAMIRKWTRKSPIPNSMAGSEGNYFGLHIYCKSSRTNIINKEVVRLEYLNTEQYTSMTCNWFFERHKPMAVKGSGQIFQKILDEAKISADKMIEEENKG